MADNEKVLVRFWEDSYPNAVKTKEMGSPVFDTVDWCEIKVPGERDTVSGPVHRMQPDPRSRFPSAWAQYQKDKGSEGVVGMPLKEVAWLARGEVETLKAAGLRTLENLADLSDANVTCVPGGLALRAKAKATLQAAKDEAPLQKMAAELAARDEQIAELRAQMKEIVEDRRRTRVKE